MKETRQNTMSGLLLTIIGFLSFSLSDALRKYIMNVVVGEISFESVTSVLAFQGGIGVLTVLLLSPFFGGFDALWKVKNLKWHWARGALMTVNTTFAVIILAALPITDAYTIYFLTPLLTAGLGAILLKDTIGLRRMLAIIGGLVGVLIAFPPWHIDFHYAHILALLACFTFGGSNLISRHIGGFKSVLAFGFWPMACLFTSVLIVTLGQINFYSSEFVFYSVLAGFTYVAALILVSMGFVRLSSSLAAPMQYTQMLYGIILGYLVFGYMPGAMKLIGAGVVIVAGLFLLERQSGARSRGQERV